MALFTTTLDLYSQVRRPDFSVFELFNAAWCVRTPQPRGTQPRLRCSVVGLLRAPLDARPAARSYRPKAAVLARFKGNNTRRPLFFSACVGMVLVNNISARKKSRREVGGPAQRLQAAVEQLTGEHSTPTLDFFPAISAGECLVVSIVTLCGAKLNSLTPLGSVVLPLLKNTM